MHTERQEKSDFSAPSPPSGSVSPLPAPLGQAGVLLSACDLIDQSEFEVPACILGFFQNRDSVIKTCLAAGFGVSFTCRKSLVSLNSISNS